MRGMAISALAVSVAGVEDAAIVDVSEVGGVEVAEVLVATALPLVSVVAGVLEALVSVEAASSTITVRVAVPVFPAWSVAEYTIVCVPGFDVSRAIPPIGVDVAPSSDASMPRLMSASGAVIVAPRSI